MNITFYKTKSESERLTKTLENAITKTCELIFPFSIESPEIKLTADYNFDYNYASFSYAGKTYYFYISNPPRIENKVMYITLNEDYLATWKDDILNSVGHVVRSSTNYNPYLPDGMITNTNKVDRQYRKVGNGFTLENTYILTVGG
ncbi:MAG: hypothetical protein MJ237_08560 [bacterium]|nr:hypothetical protein [bacterium]